MRERGTDSELLFVVSILLTGCGPAESPDGDVKLGTVSQALVQSDIQIQNYTFNTLPLPAGLYPGRLARLSDYTKDLWMDTGQWVSLGGEVVNAKVFGAKGDGVSVDDTPLAAAIAAAQSHCSVTVATLCLDNTNCPTGETCLPPKTLYIPAGTYYVTSPLVVSTGMKIQGAGMGTTTLKYVSGYPSGTDKPLLWIKPTTTNIANVSISDIAIDGSRPRNYAGSDQGSSGIEVKTVGGYTVDSVSITNVHTKATRGDGITVRQDPAASHIPTRITITNNFIEDWMREVTGTPFRQGVALVAGQGIVVSNNHFFNYTGSGYAVDLEPNASNGSVIDVTITGNIATFTGGNGGGVAVVPNLVSAITRIAITGNVLNVPGTPIYAPPDPARVTDIHQAANVWPGILELENVRTIITKSYADSACTAWVRNPSSAAFTPRSYAGQNGTTICNKNLEAKPNCAGSLEIVVKNDNSYVAQTSNLGCSVSLASPWPYGGMYITQPDSWGGEWNFGTVYVVCCY